MQDELTLIQAVCPVQQSIHSVLQTLDFVGQVQGFVHETGRIGSQVANSETAIEVATNQVADHSSFVAAPYHGAEHGSAISAVNVVAPGTHFKTGPASARRGSTHQNATQIILVGERCHHITEMPGGMNPAKVVKDPPIDSVKVRYKRFLRLLREQCLNLCAADRIHDVYSLFRTWTEYQKYYI